jgi:nucleotide-binding universal stress UspA family protein
MARPILVGHDPKSFDRAPVDFGVTVARFTGARLIIASVHRGPVVPVVPPGSVMPLPIGVDEDLVEDCTPELERIEKELEHEDITFECRALRSTSAARALHEAAETLDAGLAVVGSTRRVVAGRVLPGSTAERVIRGAPCPVAVVPRHWRARGALDTVGVGFLDTEEGREALRGALALARRARAKLRVLTVVRPTVAMYGETEARTAGQRAKYFEDVLGEHQLSAIRAARQTVAALDGGDDIDVDAEGFIGDPADVLADVSEHLDLLVCGSRAYGPVGTVLLGGVTRRVTAEARCPVIVVPRGVEASLEALLAEAPGAAATA